MVQRTDNQALLIWDHGVLMREKVIHLLLRFQVYRRLVVCCATTEGYIDAVEKILSGMELDLKFLIAVQRIKLSEKRIEFVVIVYRRSSTGTAWSRARCRSLCASS